MAYPQVANTNTSGHNTATTSHTVSLPTGISTGDLLLVFFSTDGDNTVTDWDGFNGIFNTSNTTDNSLSVAYKKATGSEGSTITITTSQSEESSHITFRITGHADPDTQDPEISSGDTGANQYPNPDSLTPTGGAEDFLWIAIAGNYGSVRG